MASDDGGADVVPPVGRPADVSLVNIYFKRIVPTLLEEDEDVDYNSSSLNIALQKAESDILRFIEDSQERSLTILRSVPPEVTEDEEAIRTVPTYNIHLGAHFKSHRCVGVVFIKRSQTIEAEKSVRSQLRLINVSEDSPYETLHAYIQDAVNPLFSSYITETRREESEGDKLASNVQKNISELAVSLLHLQQNIAIPEISLPVHPAISDGVLLATKENRKPIELMSKYLSDTTVLNALQKQVANWTKDIRKVTTMQRDVSSGTALQEISFWISMEHSLARLRSKRDSPEVVLTLDVLKAGKRFKTTISFDSDTGLNDMQGKVKDYNQLMKDFPIKDLLASDSLDTITHAIIAIFIHLKKIRNTNYPTDRAVGLVEAISKDLLYQLLKVLSSQKLMIITYTEFEDIHSSSKKVFTTWDEDFEKFQTQLRDLAKKRRDDTVKFHIKFNLSHKKLQERLIQMENFRHQHEQLQRVINRVLKLAQQQLQSKKVSSDVIDEQLLGDDELLAVKEVRLAYDSVKVVDCLDLSKDGSDAWEAALKRYDERIDRVETRIAARLRDQLGSARNAEEMFRIFSRYNALFVRPHIRGAIREYQTQLILRVKEDIEKLHIKFKTPFNKTSTYAMCMMMDIPPVSSSLMWARQIEHQLDTSLKRVEAVLGPDWGTHVDGQQLKADGEAFKQKLSPLISFEDWKKRVDSKSHGIQGYIFSINSVRARSGLQMKLVVNFNTDNISLYKEARYLRTMGFRIPFSISSLASQANQLYPHAVCLKDSIRTYELTCQKIIDHDGLVPLVAGLKIDVQELVKEGVGLTWESFKLNCFVSRFSKCIFSFQEKVDDALLHIEEIDMLINKLESCEYNNVVMTTILDDVQKIVDKLNFRSYTNLSNWVKELDKKIESRLMKRLSAAINSWTECLSGQHDEDISTITDTMDTTSTTVTTVKLFKLGGIPQVETNHHELHITKQMMYLQPPLDISRCHLIAQLHNWINTITGLQRIQSSHYQVGLEERTDNDETYRGLLGILMEKDPKPLVNAYEIIEGLLNHVEDYVTEWLQYQSLWDMEISNIICKVQEDLGEWQRLLLDIKKSHRTIDTTETVKRFGPLEIHYGKVQAKVNMKYDSWHKEIVGRFGAILGQNMQDFYTVISKARNDLENHSVDASSTSEAVQFITLLQELKRQVKHWEKQIDVYGSGQKMLERSRYQFPSIWLDVGNVEEEWGAFTEILKRKDGSMQNQIGSLQVKIVTEDKIVEEKTTELLHEWETKKPVQGEIRPDNATSVLGIYEGKFLRLKEDRDNLIKAKDALELAEPGFVTASNDDRLIVVVEELHDLKEVWSQLGKIWDTIDYYCMSHDI